MATPVLLASTSRGLARVSAGADGRWTVTWTRFDAPRALAVDTTRPGRALAGTEAGGVLRSDDAGRTWTPLATLPGPVTALAIHPAAPGTIHAGTRPARLHVSHDGGITWAELPAFQRIPTRRLWFSPASFPFSPWIQAIAPSPVDPDALIVGVEAGATVRTEDGGRTWSRHMRGSLRDCHDLRWHPANPRWVYEAGGTGAGVAVSNDGGRHWRQPRAGLHRHYGWTCVADPTDPAVWYAALAQGPRDAHGAGNARATLVRWSGDCWERVGRDLAQPLMEMPYALLTVPGSPGQLWVVTRTGAIWHGREYGEAWETLPVALGPVNRAVALPPA